MKYNELRELSNSEFKKITSVLEKQTFAVLDVLYGRSGFDHWWEDIDEEDQDDIFEEIKEAVIYKS
ncbi:MAG: hypothetical protein AABY22_22375 [Nanoarchaeota archaeon]